MPAMDLVKEEQEKLREASCIGDDKTILELLEKGVDVNSSNTMNGWTALHWAAKRGHAGITRILLGKGAESEVKNADGATPLDICSHPEVRVLLGGEPNGDAKCKDNLPITPNYIAHPPFPYASSSSNFQPAESPQTPREKSSTPVQNHASASNASPPRGGTSLDDNELVLKVRVANSVEQDFIEIEIDRSRLNFEYVLSTVCRELNVNPSIVHKLRKLPNTIVRKDKDVRRFVDFQELELVLTNRANSESSRNYGPPSVSPRHVDVVY